MGARKLVLVGIFFTLLVTGLLVWHKTRLTLEAQVLLRLDKEVRGSSLRLIAPLLQGLEPTPEQVDLLQAMRAGGNTESLPLHGRKDFFARLEDAASLSCRLQSVVGSWVQELDQTVPASVAVRFDPSFNMVSNFPAVENAVQTWLLLGAGQAAQGRPVSCLQSLLAACLLAWKVEHLSSEGAAFADKALSNRILAETGRTLVDLVPELDVPREVLISFWDSMMRLEHLEVPLSEVFRVEKSRLPMTFEAILSTDRKPVLMDPNLALPVSLARRLNGHPYLLDRLTVLFDEAIRVVDIPFIQGREELGRVQESLGTWGGTPQAIDWWRELHDVVRPEISLIDTLVGSWVPQPLQERSIMVENRMILRGGVAGLALKAFRSAHEGRWPGSLAEAGSWFGRDLDKDLFSVEPLQWQATPTPSLRSVGIDGERETGDDLEFLPPKVEEGF